jgi:hypothetical protein
LLLLLLVHVVLHDLLVVLCLLLLLLLCSLCGAQPPVSCIKHHHVSLLLPILLLLLAILLLPVVRLWFHERLMTLQIKLHTATNITTTSCCSWHCSCVDQSSSRLNTDKSSRRIVCCSVITGCTMQLYCCGCCDRVCWSICMSWWTVMTR